MSLDIIENLLQTIDDITALSKLLEIKVRLLGKKGLLRAELSKISQLPSSEKKILGKKINNLKQEATRKIEERKKQLENIKIEQDLKKAKIDITIPGRKKSLGGLHPITQATNEIIDILSPFGFISVDGPSIEDEWHNFTALNFPLNHPARNMHDTFYLQNSLSNNNKKLLRTHTSTMQIKIMSSSSPPFYFLVPGRTYRSDSDNTHTPMFHQIEGVAVDENINMGNLKFLISHLVNVFFGDVDYRLRPSFFPFTEPSAELDIKIKDRGWIEVLGCGMIHPKVLENVNLDPQKYTGFAFGLGVERFAMLKYAIKDLRDMFDGNYEWHNYYNFNFA